ncbi:hypothetical protein HOY80DRAFT_895366 [Tuber brumale]|nr:hypothetical protein HOY80DRAFT_895366 [Tuber brumale]
MHFLEPASTPGKPPESHWKIWCDDYYATASLFKDGKPKSFSLPGGPINIFSDDPVRHCEAFTLKPNSRAKFTTVFKLDHKNVPSTQPEYFDISPRLKPIDDRWWSFKTESSSFIFRRNLETILSHAMPLPKLDGEAYLPYVLHNHDLMYTYHKWCSSLNQAFYLLEIDKVLQQQNTADKETKSYYHERIRKVIFGYLVWVLRHAERNGFPENVILHWSGKEDDSERLVGEAGRNVLGGPAGGPGEAGTLHSGKPEEPVDPPLPKPVEPDLSGYIDRIENCCRFLSFLDISLTNYPDQEPLITRMVEAFLKLAWEPIEMTKHRESHLWPNWLESLGEFPPQYARFLNWQSCNNSGYGGQVIYVYDIARQVLVWKAVKATNRLLGLVPKDQTWIEHMDHEILNEKAIRHRTIEAFRTSSTGMIQSSLPDIFFLKIKGHVRERFLEKGACTIAIPSFVENFFLDNNNKPISTWTETLIYVDKSIGSAKARTPGAWESFMRYQLGIDGDGREELRESLEERAYSVGLFAGDDVVTPGSHCPSSTHWPIVTYLLSADYAKLLHPQPKIQKIIDPSTRPDGAQGSTPPLECPTGVSTNPGARITTSILQEVIEPGGKEKKGLDITIEDRGQVNDPPSYGQWYWFREPLFMEHDPEKGDPGKHNLEKRDPEKHDPEKHDPEKQEPEKHDPEKREPEKPEIKRKFIETFLLSEYNWAPGDSSGNWCCFWETDEGKDEFLKGIADDWNPGWNNEKNTVIRPYRNKKSDLFHGSKAFSMLQKQRHWKVDKKRIIVMKDCMIEHLISLMANLDIQEAGHVNKFLLRLRPMDSHEMRFEEQTIMPDNLWITEFNINFITAPFLADVESPLPQNYFPRRRAKFLSMNGAVPDRIMAEAAMGFRIIGDLHDRYWTCYVFYDFGSQGLISDARSEVERREYGHSSSQRKCLEGFLVCQALDLVLSETKTVLDTITKFMGEKKKSPALFIPLLTVDDLLGENYFDTMNKNSVFYPWLIGVYSALKGKCIKGRNAAEHWILAEEKRKYKPRWSIRDQKDFGEKVARSRADVKARCTMLKKMAEKLEERIDRVKTIKESLSSELALREARTSTQLARTVNLFAVVTAIYLPLTFSSSIVAIEKLHWKSPAKALFRIMLGVTLGTIILLMNFSFLRRNLIALKRWARRSIRQRMAGGPEPKCCSKEPTHPEKQVVWECWKERAVSLQEAEKRGTLLTDRDIHDIESDWWYWYFMVIYIIIVVPVQELTFAIRTLKFQKIEGSGPLKKVVRVPLGLILALHLALVYLIMLAGYAFLSLVGLARQATVWSWTGGEGSSGSEPDSTQKDGGLVGWLIKPSKTMKLLIVSEALQPKEKKPDEEETQGATQDATPPLIEKSGPGNLDLGDS